MTPSPQDTATSDADVSALLRMSAQRALQGQIPPSLRAVSVSASAHQIRFRCVFDSAVSAADRELLSEAATEIIADFHSPWTIAEEYVEVRTPAPMRHLEHLVFLRHEQSTPVI